MLDVNEDFTVSSKQTQVSKRNHRLSYLTTDTKMMQPASLIILPFLHENRIYLGNSYDSCFNFTTAIKVPVEDRKKFND